MKWLSGFDKFLENQNTFLPQAQFDIKPGVKINPKNLITEVCVGMLILNPTFLDDVLDRGLMDKYSQNSESFLNDLKLMLLNKNRLKLGKFIGKECVKDEEMAKINPLFENVDFDLQRDLNILIDSRVIARNICDKILQDQKLTSDLIKTVYWSGINQDKTNPQDLVIELESGRQLGIILNKSISSQKSSSFNLLGDDILGIDLDTLYKDEYISKWDKLIQNWIKIIYDNCNNNLKVHIEKFIEPERIDTIGYFEYFDIKHADRRFKNVGEYIKEFDKNILKLSDLLSEVWKHKSESFMDVELVEKNWLEKKNFLLNSKILENLFTKSLIKNYPNQIKKVESGMKSTSDNIKMRLMKVIVNKLGCLETPLYLFSNKGNTMDFIPSRDLFRKNYDKFNLLFDYHVKLNKDAKDGDFKFNMTLELKEKKIMDILITIGFSGGEMSGKLNSKFKFNPIPNFNLVLTDEMNKLSNEAKKG